MLFILKTNIKIILLAALAVLVLCGTGFAARDRVLSRGIVNAEKLNVRARPSQNSDVVTVIGKGDRVDVLEIRGGVGGWLTIAVKAGTGYVRNRSKYITLVPVPREKPVEQSAEQSEEKPVIKSIKQQVKKEKELPPEPKIQNKTADREPPDTGKEDKDLEKQEIRAKIETQEKIVQTFSDQEVSIIEGLNEIDFALNKARIKVSELSSEILEFEQKIDQLNRDREQLSKEIVQNQDYAGKRLEALYKMNMIGRLDVAGLPTTVFDFFLRQNSMKRIIASDFFLLDKQNADLEAFEILEQELKQEIRAKTLLEVELNDQIRINKKETLKKELILRDVRKKKKLSLAAVESLKQAEFDLDKRIRSIREGGGAPFLNAASFASHKGRLMVPVKGSVISEYGPSTTGDYKSFTFQKGIDIKVERGEPVKSVFKGEVMFAQWLKGYGNLMIVDHGDNYYTLYAHVEEIFKQKGERVDTGEVIATAGDTGSIKGMCLHFEVRHHGKPVNPMKWLRKGA
jgi:septal ring factor EnvC (AmiA/AmiB activator)